MKIYIAGVCHFDPSARTCLQNWLKNLASKHNTLPDFIALEWDKNIFMKIKGQREEFFRLLYEEWPKASNDILNSLKDSLGYEGDSHVDIFTDTEILWLDGGRVYSLIDSYAIDRLKMYKGFLGGNKQLELSAISKEALKVANSNSSLPSERDTKFSELILEKVREKDGWAIVIVGANHTRNEAGYMRRILEDNKLICEVTIIRLGR